MAEEPQGEPSIVEPQVTRREVKTPKIKAKDFELGAYFGALSIQDFGTNPVYGVRAAYHVSEDIFFEGYVARSKAGTTSLEDVFPGYHGCQRLWETLHVLRLGRRLQRTSRARFFSAGGAHSIRLCM